MKQFLILILGITLFSCGGEKKQTIDEIIMSDDLTQIRQKRTELVTQQQDVINSLKKLDEAIAKLDSVEKLPLITTYTVKEQEFVHYFDLQGSVQTKQNMVLMPEISGILTNVHVRNGQRVSKGQVLATIDDSGLSQQLAQLEINEELAKTTFERQKRLWDQKIGSEIQFLQAQSAYEAQQKAVSQLKKQLEKTKVIAPYSGIIDDIISEEGTVVGAGMTPLLRIINLNNMYIEAVVPEKYLAYITKGTSVRAYFPVLQDTIDSKIRQISNFIDPNNRTFKVEIGVPNRSGKIKPNLTARLNINDYTNKNAILVPQNIISENADGEQYVYAISNVSNSNTATATKTFVKTGKTKGDLIEIKEGLSNNIQIVLEGSRSVRDGQKVEILNL